MDLCPCSFKSEFDSYSYLHILLAFSSSFIFINSFCHWLSEYLLSICSVPVITLGAGDKRWPWADTGSFFPMETTVCCQGADSGQVRRRWRQRYLRRKAMRFFICCPWQGPIQECGKDNNLIGVDLWKERSEEVEKLKQREWEKREREQERAIVNTFS